MNFHKNSLTGQHRLSFWQDVKENIFTTLSEAVGKFDVEGDDKVAAFQRILWVGKAVALKLLHRGRLDHLVEKVQADPFPV